MTTGSKIEQLVNSIKSLNLVQEVVIQEDLLHPELLFRSINNYDAVPFSRILLGATRSKKKELLEDCLDNVDFKGKCYLCVIRFASGWHWSEVESDNPGEWILDLLLRNDVDDFLVVSHTQTSFLGLIEDEAEYLIFVSKSVRNTNSVFN